jgi:hypothetical protein
MVKAKTIIVVVPVYLTVAVDTTLGELSDEIARVKSVLAAEVEAHFGRARRPVPIRESSSISEKKGLKARRLDPLRRIASRLTFWAWER